MSTTQATHRVKIGAIGSPTILLNHVFHEPYRRLLEGLSSQNDLFLLGNMGTYTPSYAKGYIKLNQLPLFGEYLAKSRNYFRVVQLGNTLSMFQWLWRAVGTILDDFVAKKAIKYFKVNGVNLIYALPTYPESYLQSIQIHLRKPLLLEFWEDQIAFLYDYWSSKGLRGCKLDHEINKGYKWLESTCHLASHIVVPTSVLKERLVSLGLSRDKISIVPVCSDPFIPLDGKAIKKRHRLRNTRILFYLGSLSLYHDIGTVLRALNELTINDISLVIAGGWREPTKMLKKSLVNPKINVVYAGRLNEEELRGYMSIADICIASYRFRYPSGFFPQTVIRFMLSGKPLIATDLPEIREMLRGKKAGILVPQGDPIALAQSIELLLSNENLRLKLGNMARNLAESNYLWSEHNERLQEIIHQIVG